MFLISVPGFLCLIPQIVAAVKWHRHGEDASRFKIISIDRRGDKVVILYEQGSFDTGFLMDRVKSTLSGNTLNIQFRSRNSSDNNIPRGELRSRLSQGHGVPAFVIEIPVGIAKDVQVASFAEGELVLPIPPEI